MRLRLLFILCIWTINTSAQIRVSGKLIDEQTQEPLAYASVRLAGTSLGTSTNADGEFDLRINQSIEQRSLTFSYLGYASKTVPLTAFMTEINQLITLQRVDLELEEFVVKNLSPQEIITQAVEKIPDNYGKTSYNMQSFYREMIYVNDTLSGLTEAVLEGYRSGFHVEADGNADQSILLSGKNFENFYDSELSSQIAAVVTPTAILNFEPVRNKGYFLDKRSIKLYNWELVDVVSFDGRAVYHIKFDHDDKPAKALYEGDLYIDKESFAFVKLDYQYSERGIDYINKEPFSLTSKLAKTALGMKLVTKDIKFSFGYQFVQDVWRLTSFQMINFSDFRSNKFGENKIELTVDYLITEITNSPGKFYDKYEALPTRKSMGRLVSRKDDPFWENYNGLKASKIQNEQSQQLIQQINDKLLAEGAFNTKISGKVINEADKYIWITGISDPLVMNEQRLALAPIEEGAFELSFAAPYSGLYKLVIDDVAYPLFIKQGENKTVTLDPSKSLLDQEQSYARLDTALSEKRALLKSAHVDFDTWMATQQAWKDTLDAAKLDYDTRVFWLGQYHAMTLDLLTDSRDREFIKTYLQAQDFNNSAFIYTPGFANYFIATLKNSTSGNGLASLKESEKFIEQNFDLSIKPFLLAKLYYNAFQIDGLDVVESNSLIQEYKSNYPTAPYLASLEEAFAQYKDLKAGKPLIVEGLLGEDGKRFALDSLSGKVVILDLWASWCSICLEEFRDTYPDLQANFAEDEVAFLFVNVDDDPDDWKRTRARIAPPGVHVWAEGGLRSAIATQLGLRGIPRYLILDQRSRVIDIDASLDEALTPKIKALLAQ